MAVHNLVPGLALCRRANPCLDPTPIPGIRARQQRELLLLLRPDGCSRSARLRRARRSGTSHLETESVRPAKEHSGRHFALLAFHGCAVAVSAYAALDEALTQSKVGGNVSQADLSIHGQVSRTGATEIMTAPTFSVPAKKMAMWLFIIADTATFAGCLVAYGFTRNATPDWPRPFHSIVNVASMTFILLTSSLTMLIAIREAEQGKKDKAFRWMIITALLGVLFAFLHIREWLELIDKGLTLFHNPYGTPMFGGFFFSVTGLHLTHVIGGVIALIAVGIRYRGGRYNAADIEITGLYWHFVDLVWMFVVPFMYLMNLGH